MLLPNQLHVFALNLGFKPICEGWWISAFGDATWQKSFYYLWVLGVWLHKGSRSDFVCPFPYQIGRYDEVRWHVSHELFGGDLHVGIDIGAPVGEPIHSFDKGVVYSLGVNAEDGSYGPTIIVEYELEESQFGLFAVTCRWNLSTWFTRYGCRRGPSYATVDDKSVNGGWEPHLHFQLSWEKPEGNDIPGCSKRRPGVGPRKVSNPRMVLGPLY